MPMFRRAGHRPRPFRRVYAALVTAAAIAVALALSTPSAAAAPNGNRDLGVDEISHSKNVRHVAHLPKHPPFDNQDDFASDIAFKGDYAFQGNYGGFTVYDISHPKKPKVVSTVDCAGGQGDISVSARGDLLFLSVDYARTDSSCSSKSSSPTVKDAWEGMRIFDISDVHHPRYVKGVRTDCGSHTHTLVPSKGGQSVYLYVSSYGPSDKFPHCKPPHDSISIVEVPLDSPADASVTATPNLFPGGGAPGTSGCHDITVYPEKDIAAGSCMGQGILMDISDRDEPRVLDSVQDSNFAFWHSATFTNDASQVVLTDELGGGGAPECNADVGPKRGADGIYDIVGKGDNRHLKFHGYYKMPRYQQDTENCVAHNGSLVPVKGRDVMVQAWYQGGVSVWEFTDSSNPHEIGYFERGPLSAKKLILGGSWSAYYYNGFIYSSDIQKGLDVLKVVGDLSSAKRVQLDILNAQTQYSYPE